MINIGFTGDFCPQERVEIKYVAGNWKETFADVKPFFDRNQLNVIETKIDGD